MEEKTAMERENNMSPERLKIHSDLLTDMKDVPVVDVHSHLNPEKPQAENVGDILFYHFVLREIHAAGGNMALLASPASLEEKMKHYLDFLPLIENTTTVWCLRKILKDIYQIDASDEGYWRILKEKIEKGSRNPSWPEDVFSRKLNLERFFACGDEWDKSKSSAMAPWSAKLRM